VGDPQWILEELRRNGLRRILRTLLIQDDLFHSDAVKKAENSEVNENSLKFPMVQTAKRSSKLFMGLDCVYRKRK
jgi:predicted metal-dependent HD superfamily phosphohydrolase